jgi:pilus assembly protein CpaE
MTRLEGIVVSGDEAFTTQVGGLLRSAGVMVRVAAGGRHGSGSQSDVAIVDGRQDAAAAIARVEELRAQSPAVAIFLVSDLATPDLLLQSMRAGANEFLTWPIDPHPLDEGIRRAVARRQTHAGGKTESKSFVFIGAKGGMGTTTVAVNCGVEMAILDKRTTVLVDLKAGLGEVALFAGVRNSYSIIDAIDNLHRLDGEFLRELLVRHKSGLEILAGSDHFERPAPGDSPAVEEIFRLLAQRYDHVLVDAGCQVNASVVPVLFAADTIFVVANPDVPSVRNAQRMIERIRKLGPCAERIRIVLNRTAAPYQIPLPQIEAALGSPIYQTLPSDYRTVASALNSGTPLSMTGRTEIAKRFAQFTKRILDPASDAVASSGGRTLLRFGRLATFS